MLDHKVFTFFNELYKTLKQQDVEILKHFNCDEVSDNDYFSMVLAVTSFLIHYIY